MKLSIVTSVYYSEKYLHEFYSRTVLAVKELLNRADNGFTSYEFILVNDGSPDNSLQLLEKLAAANPEIVVLNLSRNYGHHYALRAGLDHSSGDFVFLIDCDLEESPELLVDFWDRMATDSDIDVVYGVQQKRKGKFIEVYLGKLFYLFLNGLMFIDYPHDSLTARLMNRKFMDAVLTYPEKTLELWSVFTLVGFRQESFFTTKLSKGSTTYNFGRKLKLAIETITATSSRPLYFIFLVGILIFCLSGAYLSYIVFIALTEERVVEGWASTIASIWLVGGITFLLLGVIAIYLAKIFQEVKSRPLYSVKSVIKQSQSKDVL